MPLMPVLPPAPAPILSGFDYVTVDAQRHRVYAAHSGNQALLIVNADSGAVLGQVRVGPLHGVAVDPRRPASPGSCSSMTSSPAGRWRISLKLWSPAAAAGWAGP